MMNNEDRLILKNQHDNLSKVRLEDLSPYLKEYKIFNRYMWKDISSTEKMLEMLPHRGPKAFLNFIEILRKAGYFTVADLLEDKKLVKTTDSSLFYVMSSYPLGFCLIINNVKFDKLEDASGVEKKLADRLGSNIDSKNLCDFFEKCGFEVTVETNKKASQMFACLKSFSKRDFAEVASAIIIILSHGNQINKEDVIYGTDGNYISKSEILEIFNNKDCRQLLNKPKVFFFVCCRGTELDYGVSKCLPSESIDSRKIILPTFSDMFIVHSTLPDQVSVRDEDKGSFFCEELIKVLKENFRRQDLETMIKFVNRNLQNKVSIMYRTIQAAHVEVLGGTKKIKFCRTES